jgi:antitoxin (DNA-binding transcriptional repressor) of toxin-antitoxin stability system
MTAQVYNQVMTTMTLTEAKDRLAELLAKAAEGEEVVIVRDDGSAFTVVPTQVSPRTERGLIGSARGQIKMADDADETTGEPDPDATPIQRRPRRELFGSLEGKIWIAPDFDDIPEGFEPYLGDDYKQGD